MEKKKRILGLLFAVLLLELAGAFGSLSAIKEIPVWYASLNKPGFTPPDWAFAPIWLTLYALMGIAAFLVYEKGFGKKKVKIALNAFALQLSLNLLWSLMFFGMHQILFGLVDVAILFVAISFTMANFYKVSKTSAFLLVPYLAWVAIATVLNLSVFLLN